MVPTSKGDQNMSRPEDQCNLDDLQALTMGTENLMFPTDDTDTPMGQIPVPHGMKLDSAVIPQAEVHQPLSMHLEISPISLVPQVQCSSMLLKTGISLMHMDMLFP